MKDRIEGCSPFFQRLILAHKKLCAHEFRKEGISMFYYCGYRSPSEQNVLYAIGRADTKDKRPPVTWAKGGESIHQYGWAVDFVPVLGGKLLWEDHETYERAGIMAESLGMEWAGRWSPGKREYPHIQFTGGLLWSEMALLLMGDRDAHIEERYRAMGFMKTLLQAENNHADSYAI